MKCEVEGCFSEAVFAIYRTVDIIDEGETHVEKEWVEVCDKCERRIAKENLKRIKEAKK